MEPPIEVNGDSLVLFFSGTEAIQLERTVFSHRLIGGVQRAVRGKTAGALNGYETFQWTSGVQALAAFLTEIASWSSCPRAHSHHVLPRLIGDSGSLASALDFSLSKQPLWLCDLFGCDKQGRAFARTLFRRTNPERKRPGPVVITLNTKLLEPAAVRIVLNGTELVNGRALQALAGIIVEDWKANKCGLETAPKETTRDCNLAIDEPGDSTWVYDPCRSTLNEAEFSDSLLHIQVSEQCRPTTAKVSANSSIRSETYPGFVNIVYDEVCSMLRQTDIFNRRAMKLLTDELLLDESFTRVAGRVASVINEIDRSLPSSGRLGLVDDPLALQRTLKGTEPIRCAVAPAQAGATALLYTLRSVHGFNISLVPQFAHSLEIARRIIDGELDQVADLCVLSAATAATVLSSPRQTGFRPFMIMPRISHRVMSAGKNGRDLRKGRYVFLSQSPSTTGFYFDQLKRVGRIPSKISVEHFEPDETTKLLAEKDPEVRAIMWFPCYQFNEAFNDCVTCDDGLEQYGQKLTLLFAHESFLADTARATALDVALRDAWLQLREGGPLLKRIVNIMVDDEQYTKPLFRTAGLHNLPIGTFGAPGRA